MVRVFVAATAAGVFASASAAQLFQPDSATASSEFSSLYDVGNTIDGSGLPDGFYFNTPHATYVGNNHWTTRSNPAEATATFFFDEPRQIRQFFLWNHRSNGVAADPNYAVKRFTLVFFDGDGVEVARVEDLAAEQNNPRAQLYAFDLVEGVRSVRVEILENYGSQYWGFAEVAFSPTVLACSGADLQLPVGALDLFDLLAYMDLFTAQDPWADLAEPIGEYNIFDLMAYIDLYSAGCL